MTVNILELAILVTINAFSIFLIIVVLSNSFNDRLYKWFVFMTICLIGWVDFSYLGYLENDLSISIIAYRLNLACVSAFFLAAYIFYIECFLKIFNQILKTLLLIFSLTFSLLSLFTDTIIFNVVTREWGNEIVFGGLYNLFSVFSILVTTIFIYFFISKYFIITSSEKQKIRFFIIGTFLMIILNLIFNVLSPLILNTAQYQHYGDYSAVIFLGFTAYAIFRYKLLNVKTALTAFLISVIGLLIIVDILVLSNDVTEQVVKLFIFIFYLVISVLLVRSVLNEMRQNEKLEAAYDQVQALRQHEQDMIDIMGHELRTPITIVRNSLGVMDMEFKKNGTIAPEHLGKFIDIAMESARREVKLVETLLSSAKADSKGFQLLFEKVDIADVVSDSLVLFKKEGEKKGLQVIFEQPSEDYFVFADRVRTQEIVDNLIGNAVKYTEKGEVKITMHKEDSFVWVEVTDTGIGISDEDMKSLGQKFYRVDQYIGEQGQLKKNEKKNIIRPGGTGLGLYVTFSLIELMDGAHTVESEIGKGSKFSFKLPEFVGQEQKQEQRKIEN